MAEYVPNSQMLRFWNEKINPVISSFVNKRHKFPALQDHYNNNITAISSRYPGGKWAITMHDKETPDMIGKNQSAPFGCRKVEDCPIVSIYVPTLKLIYQDLKTLGGNTNLVFENEVAVGFLHELDHLALGMIGSRDSTHESMILAECQVWARTCDRVVSRFVERDWLLSPSTLSFYKAWVDSGKRLDSPHWIEFIRQMYGQIKMMKG